MLPEAGPSPPIKEARNAVRVVFNGPNQIGAQRGGWASSGANDGLAGVEAGADRFDNEGVGQIVRHNVVWAPHGSCGLQRRRMKGGFPAI